MNIQGQSLAPNVPWAEGVEDNPLSLLLGGLGDSFGTMFDLFSVSGIVGFLGDVWSIYATLAYIISIILLAIYVYATVRWNHFLDLQYRMLRDAEALWDERYRGVRGQSRLQQVFEHSAAAPPNDWKLAIIEADIVLDEVLKERGYVGNSLGERLRTITPAQLNTLDDAWEAHKVRNKIAHGGTDFVLTKRLANETVARYQRVFNEFGVT